MAKNHLKFPIPSFYLLRALVGYALIHQYESSYTSLEREAIAQKYKEGRVYHTTQRSIRSMAPVQELPDAITGSMQTASCSPEIIWGLGNTIAIPGYPTLMYSGLNLEAIARGLITPNIPRDEAEQILNGMLFAEEKQTLAAAGGLPDYEQPKLLTMVSSVLQIDDALEMGRIISEDIAKAYSPCCAISADTIARHLLTDGTGAKFIEGKYLAEWYGDQFPRGESRKRADELLCHMGMALENPLIVRPLNNHKA